MKNAKQLITKENIHSVTDRTIVGFMIGGTKAFVMKEGFFHGGYISIVANKIHLHNTWPSFYGNHVADIVELLVKENGILVYSFKNESCLLRWLAAKH